MRAPDQQTRPFALPFYFPWLGWAKRDAILGDNESWCFIGVKETKPQPSHIPPIPSKPANQHFGLPIEIGSISLSLHENLWFKPRSSHKVLLSFQVSASPMSFALPFADFRFLRRARCCCGTLGWRWQVARHGALDPKGRALACGRIWALKRLGSTLGLIRYLFGLIVPFSLSRDLRYLFQVMVSFRF